MNDTSATADVLHVDPTEYTLEELYDILAGRSQRLRPIVALNVLRRKSYPEEQKVADLQRILLDEGAAPRLRTAAAVELGRLGTPSARSVLAAQSASANPLLNRAAQLGLRELNRMQGQPGVEREQPVLAETMTRAVGPVLEVDPQRAQAITHRKAPADMAKQIVTDLAAEVPDVVLETDTARTLRCADRTLAFVAAKTAADLTSTLEPLAQPVVAGVVAVKETVESGKWTARYYLLAGPEEQAGKLALRLVSGRGRVFMIGEAIVEGGRASFTLRSVTGPGNVPTELAGSYSDGQLRLTEARSEPRVAEQFTPSRR